MEDSQLLISLHFFLSHPTLFHFHNSPCSLLPDGVAMLLLLQHCGFKTSTDGFPLQPLFSVFLCHILPPCSNAPPILSPPAQRGLDEGV